MHYEKNAKLHKKIKVMNQNVKFHQLIVNYKNLKFNKQQTKNKNKQKTIKSYILSSSINKTIQQIQPSIL